MLYNYGSPPTEGYDYVSFVKHLAPALPKNDNVFFYEESLQWRKNKNKIPLALFQNICHWKSPRRFQKVLQNTAERVNEQWQNGLQGLNNLPYEAQAIQNVFNQLTKLDGVKERTASALLTAWNPTEFGILDYKVLEVLDIQRNYSVKTYLEYRNRLLELKAKYIELNDCALRQIELALWHYYPIQKIR